MSDSYSSIAVNSEAAPLFQQILDHGCTLRVRVTGRSMTPFIRGGDIVTLQKTPQSDLQKGNLILFRNNRCNLVLHRIIKIEPRKGQETAIQTKGDAANFDEPVPIHRVMGKVCKIEKAVPFWGVTHIDMESVFWKGVSYLIAIVTPLNPSIREPIFLCYRGLKVVFRPFAIMRR